jgi:hypothetical protein
MIAITRLPTHRNDGTLIEPVERQEILDEVVKRFGGFSLDGPGEGGWMADDGTVYAEASYVLTIQCPRDRYPEMRALVIDIGKRLHQLAMYFEVRYFDGAEIIPIQGDPS